MVNLVAVVAVLALTTALLAYYVQYDRKDMDLATYFLVRVLCPVLLPEVFPTYHPDNPKLWRYRMNRTKKSGKFIFGGSVTDRTITVHDGASIPIKIFHPASKTQDHLPVIVWFHGGGWFTGSTVADEKLCSKISAYSNMLVVSVEYRMAPEYIYPTAVLDSESALKWVAENIGDYGGKQDEIYLMGESAGANLAAALTSRNLDLDLVPASHRLPIRATTLIYPPLASNGSFSSYVNNRGYSFLTAGQMERMRELYAGKNNARAAQVRSEYAFAPLHTPKSILKEYPTTIMVVAKHDVLADECLVFADKLRRRDVKVISQFYSGSTHGFFGMDEVPDGDKAVRFVTAELSHISKRLNNRP